jgi:uncharacterized protein (UPF0333 family)
VSQALFGRSSAKQAKAAERATQGNTQNVIRTPSRTAKALLKEASLFRTKLRISHSGSLFLQRPKSKAGWEVSRNSKDGVGYGSTA